MAPASMPPMTLVSEAGEVTAWPLTETMTSPALRPAFAAVVPHRLPRTSAPELAGARSVLLPALDVLCSFESYELLRFDQRLSRPKTEGALVAALTTLLGTTGGAP